MLDLAVLKNFLVVARTGSISLTAQQVGRTQSAVSMQMKRLEEQVGMPLLHRGGAGVRLTAAGEKLMLHAEALLARHDEILNQMGDSGLSGAVTLGCPEDYSIAYLPDVLQRFCTDNPQVELRLICAPTTELRPLLLRRQVDLALLSVSDATASDVIRTETFVWVASDQRPKILDLPELPLALSAPTTIDYRAVCDAMDQIGRRYRVAFASNSLAGLIAIARSGQAISVFTSGALPPDLHVLEAGLPRMAPIGISLEYAELRPSPAARALGEQIRADLPKVERKAWR